MTENERKTRKGRIDPRLDAAGWTAHESPTGQACRTEEVETDNGPADYALWLEKRLVGVVEAKRVTLGPQNVLTQAERYARGLPAGRYNFSGLRCPFLYSTNGEVFWFHDVRHPLNRSRRVAGFHTPNGLAELLGRDFDKSCNRLLALPRDNERLRPYQKDANAAVESAIAARKRNLLVAMATGTGKTFTLVNQIYRLMKAGVATRVLFLVDRRALAAQAVRAFAAYEVEPGLKFDQVYETFSSRFQTHDFGDDDRFDPKVMPTSYLTNPQPGAGFVYVCTIQRMAINILGRQAVFATGDDEADDDAERLNIPIHAFDVIVADECHRGYTSQEVSTWRSTLDHFDAIKIGLTATPASHTAAFFTSKVFEYSFKQAVEEGYLVGYDVVKVHSDVRMKGLFLKEGEHVEVVDPGTGLSQMDLLEDERHFDTADLETKVTAPESNRKILEEVARHAAEHNREYGRFPKTLIFAVNDVPHTSHADQLVDLARDTFGQGDSFVEKITGRVDRPLQRIREFRNRAKPAIAVTVDLLTTGVDIPDLEFIVLLRPVKSRILFEQMLGRGTRLGERFRKDHFTVFDCFDGTLLAYFKNATGITAEELLAPTRPIAEIVSDIWANRDRDYNIGCLAKRLQRIDKAIAGEARDVFAAFIPDGDLACYARSLPQQLRNDFVATMALLRNADFQRLLVSYPRPQRTFVKAHEYSDEVRSERVLRDVAGNEYKPDDYLHAFANYVQDNRAHVEAIGILLARPRDWNPAALEDLRTKLVQTPLRFTVEKLQRAHELRYSKALIDIISMVKHAADAQSPLLTASERVEAAFAKVAKTRAFSSDERQWLDRIRQHLQENLSIGRDDFDVIPILSNAGGWGAARRVFGEQQLNGLLHHLNEAIAA